MYLCMLMTGMPLFGRMCNAIFLCLCPARSGIAVQCNVIDPYSRVVCRVPVSKRRE